MLNKSPEWWRKKISEEENHEIGVGKSYISAMEWRDLSIQGKVCAILGCQDSPTIKCQIQPTCGVHYCQEHTEHYRKNHCH